MKIISHRGLISGLDKNRENNPKYIEECIKMGFDIEIDVWSIKDQLFLGHDNPQYPIELEWLNNRSNLFIRNNLWIHCKNLEALDFFSGFDIYPHIFNSFWHENDQFTLTSNQKIWQAHTKEVSNNSIIVDLNLENNYNSPELKNVYGVCTDYPVLLKERLKIETSR